jgi:hypothetical protein
LFAQTINGHGQKETPDAEEVHERLKCDGLLRLGLMERLIGN